MTERLGSHPGLSRTRLQGLIADGRVILDGHPVLTASFRVQAGNEITLAVPPAVAAIPLPQDIPLRVVFEDQHLLVLDKPAGLVVHPAAGHADGTLVNALVAHCGDSLSGIGGVRRPGIVHRLDKDTSGLMVVAKTDASHQGLVAVFADHGRTTYLERRYLALVWGEPVGQDGMIDRPLGRHPHHRDRMAVVAAAQGRRAVTHWRRLQSLNGVSLIECRLETGRTHQIRVHLTSLGHPLLGDPVYGAGFRTKLAKLERDAGEMVAGFARQALHAATLGFDHPITGERLTFEAPPPADFQNLRNALSPPVR